MISSGSQHNLCAASNGQMYAFGRNSHCQLGFDTNEENVERPTAHPFFKAVENENDSDNEHLYRQIECGAYHSGVVDVNGNTFLFGNNNHGQIGMGSREIKKVHQPFKITGFKCKQIAIGFRHTLMLAEGGNEVYACGFNHHKQCFQMENGGYVMSPALCTREAMGIEDQLRYGNVVRVIAGYSNSIIVVEQI